jgi:V-type H+-transporting ATPase subunit H
MLSAVTVIEPKDASNVSTCTRDDLIEQVKLTIISHPYLDDTLNNIRQEPVPWEDYKQVGLISENEMAMIKYVENKSIKELEPIMAEVYRSIVSVQRLTWITLSMDNIMLYCI